MAPVVEVRVREGEAVTAGQILALLDGREQQDAVDAARDGLEAARVAAEAQRDATARDKTLYERQGHLPRTVGSVPGPRCSRRCQAGCRAQGPEESPRPA